MAQTDPTADRITVFIVDDAQSAVHRIAEHVPDVVLMDLVLPLQSGTDPTDQGGVLATRRIREISPHTQVVVLTSFSHDELILSAIKAGALGYLLKDTEPDDLINAIRQVYLGESSLSPTVARKVLEEVFHPSEKPLSPDPLTKREVEVLQVLAKGKSNRNIATELSISETTVRTHVSNILGKLHLASRTEAALYALKEGMAKLEDDS